MEIIRDIIAYFLKKIKKKPILPHFYVVSDDIIKEGDWFISNSIQVYECHGTDERKGRKRYFTVEGRYEWATWIHNPKKIVLTSSPLLGAHKCAPSCVTELANTESK